MTDAILKSNNTSVLLRTLTEANVADLSYEMDPSYPILAKKMQTYSTVSSLSAGSEVSFNLNKTMLLRDIEIESTLTFGTNTPSIDAYIGLSAFSWIQLRSNNKVILTLTDAALRAKVDMLPLHKKIAILYRALQRYTETTAGPVISGLESLITATTATTIRCYTPVFFSFFEDTTLNFDLDFFEQMQLVVKLNTSEKMGAGTGLMSGATVAINTWSWVPEMKYYNSLRSKNMDPKRILNMLTYNTYTETLTPLTSTATSTIRLNVNYPVFCTSFMIQNIATAGNAAHARVNTFDLSLSGTKLYESCKRTVGKRENEMMGGSSIGLDNTAGTHCLININETAGGTDNVLKHGAINLHWGLDMSFTRNSGAVSFSQINAPSLTANYYDLTVSDYALYVVHWYWNILSLDPSNGTVEITTNV